MLLLIDLLDPGECGRSVTLLCVVTMKSDSNLTPELSRAAKRLRLERIVRLPLANYLGKFVRLCQKPEYLGSDLEKPLVLR